MIQKFKNGELEPTMVQIYGIQTEKGGVPKAVGLLHESVTIGVKNRLNKIHKAMLVHLQEYLTSRSEKLKEIPVLKEDADDAAKEAYETAMAAFSAELKELDDQENEVTFDPIDFTKIENVESDFNYNFELLSKICENYS